MQAVAVTGVLAAVAIPAYQDYTKRAKLMQVKVNVGMIKDQVAYAQMMGAPLEELDAGKHGIIESFTPNESIERVEVEDGTITFFLDKATFSVGYSVPFVRYEYPTDESKEWVCTSNLEPKFRETVCGF